MAKYIITKSFWHKGYVFLFSYIQSMPIACWSTHKCDAKIEEKGATRKYAQAYQEEHDKQLDGFVKMEQEKQAEEMKEKTVDDQTGESMVILNKN